VAEYLPRDRDRGNRERQEGQLLPSAPKMIQGRNPTMSRSMNAGLLSLL
jgi:hypothetical protein